MTPTPTDPRVAGALEETMPMTDAEMLSVAFLVSSYRKHLEATSYNRGVETCDHCGERTGERHKTACKMAILDNPVFKNFDVDKNVIPEVMCPSCGFIRGACVCVLKTALEVLEAKVQSLEEDKRKLLAALREAQERLGTRSDPSSVCACSEYETKNGHRESCPFAVPRI